MDEDNSFVAIPLIAKKFKMQTGIVGKFLERLNLRTPKTKQATLYALRLGIAQSIKFETELGIRVSTVWKMNEVSELISQKSELIQELKILQYERKTKHLNGLKSSDVVQLRRRYLQFANKKKKKEREEQKRQEFISKLRNTQPITEKGNDTKKI